MEYERTRSTGAGKERLVQDIMNHGPDVALTIGKENIEVSYEHELTANTKFLLAVRTSEEGQGWVVYLSVLTSKSEQKWLAFGNVKDITYKLESEHVFRVGFPDKTIYAISEFILEKIRESKLQFKGEPTRIDKIRFRSDKNNSATISFYYKIVD